MNEKEVLTVFEERRRLQSSLLSTFEEIAQTFLNSVSGKRGNGKVFISIQDYLDDSVLINGAYCSRRNVLLAIHDLKEELEAPSALQSEALAKLALLHVRPVPQVTFYQDIATAILRMEVVIRLEAMQAFNQSAPGAAGLWASAQTARQQRRRSTWKRRTIGYGLAAVACSAGAIIFLQNGHEGDLRAGAPAQLAANVETTADTQWRAGKPQWPAGDCVGKLDRNPCTLGAAPGYDQRTVLVIGNSFSAAEFVYSALTEAGLGSVTGTFPRNAPTVREIPNHSSWATSVEANYIARPALQSEVKTQ